VDQIFVVHVYYWRDFASKKLDGYGIGGLALSLAKERKIHWNLGEDRSRCKVQRGILIG